MSGASSVRSTWSSSPSRTPRCRTRFAIAVHTPQGVVLHSGDFVDLTPVDGRRTDLARIGSIAATEGVRLLLSDSTNAQEHGYAERAAGRRGAARAVRRPARRRIITSSFASHIHRIQQIADAAIASGLPWPRFGMSIKKNVRLARDLGLLTIPDAPLIDIEEVDRLAPEQVCIISTGSQGEPMSAGLMASGENRWLKVGEHDTVILSSHAIPGNEFNVSPRIDGLLRNGAEVVHSGVSDARHGPRPGRRASRRCCRSRGPSSSCPSTASTGTWWPTPSWPH